MITFRINDVESRKVEGHEKISLELFEKKEILVFFFVLTVTEYGGVGHGNVHMRGFDQAPKNDCSQDSTVGSGREQSVVRADHDSFGWTSRAKETAVRAGPAVATANGNDFVFVA